MTGTIGSERQFRPVDPLIIDAPRPITGERFSLPPIGFRPDIEGLRALAVVLVVAFHADLGPFGGGFIGVDVFFVVSGFLITSLLLGEVARTGTVSLPGFWARRARRLLPASCVVIVATLLAAQFLYDPLLLGNLARDAVAACSFVINFLFAAREAGGEGGYFDAELAKSPLLHFWSLAVEEQFYLVWPLVVWWIAKAARRFRHDLTMVMATAWVASAVACVWLTDSNTPWAFYSLPTRAWELLTGALLAVSIVSLRRIHRALVLPMAAAGLAIIAVAAVGYHASTTFPGIAAAAPVLGTALVIAAGCAVDAPSALRSGLGCAPLLWVGQRSYAIYLWHWPALVLIGVKWGPLSVAQRLVVVAGSVVVAAVSYWLVENPIRHSSWLSRRPRRSLLAGASILAVPAVLAALFLAVPRDTTGGGAEAASLTLPDLVVPVAPDGAVGTMTVAATTPPAETNGSTTPTTPTTSAVTNDSAASTTSEAASTSAAATMSTAAPTSTTTTVPVVAALDALVDLQQQLLAQGLTTQEVPSNMRPGLGDSREMQPTVYADGCVLERGDRQVRDCVYGVPSSPVTVAILGDSHAAHWFPALQKISLDQGWRLLYFAKQGCPPSEQPLRNGAAPDCDPWRRDALARIAAERPALTILTGYHYEAPEGSAYGNNTLWRQGMSTTLTVLGDLAADTLILGDTPTQYANIPQCLASSMSSVGNCVSQRSYAERPERLQVEAELAVQFGAHFVDPTDWLCTVQACPVIMGDLLMYRDRNHLTPPASEALAPLLEAALVPLVAS
ncbi:MAG: acyltransferase family protein [Ilumatobacteraceae bacterium]